MILYSLFGTIKLNPESCQLSRQTVVMLPQVETQTSSDYLHHHIAALFQAKFNYDLAGLMAKLQDVGERQNYAWIRTRIERMWPSWTAAARSLEKKQNMTGRDTKRVGS